MFLFIFLDGLGIPVEKTNFLYDYAGIKHLLENCRAVDSIMGVKGKPQSGTGQTSLFCGVNAQKIINRHHYAFPDESLRKIIREKNIFSKLKKENKKVCFANAYSENFFKKTRLRRSVTTWMTCYSKSKFLLEPELISGQAVYHDITNCSYSFKKEKYIITPDKAARNLLNISAQNNFTLFEYFLTDRIGHQRNDKKHLKTLSDFLIEIFNRIDNKTKLIITSDHGNLEDPESKSHTFNKVPLFTNFDYNIAKVNSLKDIISICR
ncbi:MAG: hypothetical protein ACQESP_09920 [Candidatus Muiribacteriota bacterium]